MKIPEIDKDKVGAKIISLPQRLLTYIITLPKRILAGIKSPKQRKKWFFQGLFAIGALFVLILTVFLLTWLGLFGSIPNKKTLLGIRQPEASKIYSVDGKLMGKYYTKNRNTLKFEDIPPAFM